jgi:glutathione-specific gamma-glutamylcyclotransferase
MPPISSLWIFGYGSLIWRPSYPFAEKRLAYIIGYERRLWQGSPDHRGTPSKPGRVATLIERDGAQCWGIAYRVAPELQESILHELDVREQAGYERIQPTLFDSTGKAWGQGLAYRAGESVATNPFFLGPKSEERIASHVAQCAGPSGSNSEYVLKLAQALRELHVEDPHIQDVESALLRLTGEMARA